VTTLAPVTADAVEADTVRQLLDRYSPAVVSVEAVVRTEMQMGGQGQDEESEIDLVGAVVDPGGLVMIWNSRISSARIGEMMRLMGRDGGDFDIEMTPLSFDVRIPGQEEPVEAFLAASDPQLDLAFLQLAEPPAEPMVFFDVGGGEAAGEGSGDLEGGEIVGAEVFAVSRLSTSFTHAPFLGTGRVVGELVKPRRAWIVSGDFQTYGMPLFTADGRVVGVLSTVVSSVAADRATAQMQGGMANMMGGGDGKTMGPIGSFALPAEAVARAVERSLERARELAAERASGSGGEEPAGDAGEAGGGESGDGSEAGDSGEAGEGG